MATKRLQDLKSSKGNARKDKDKPGSTKKAERTPAKRFHGWDLPFLQDDNDIVSWMTREKNGDNKRKPRPNEELPEEGFRHDFFRCQNLENQMEFERESLHERYRKNSQVGAKLTETNNTSISNLKKLKEEEEISNVLPARKLRFPRSCKSAELPATPKIGASRQVGLGFPDSENPTPLALSRSHSVIDDTRLKAYGLTLPPDEKTLRLLELAEKFTAKGEKGGKRGVKKEKTFVEETVDEGYDSKVSSNDNDADDDAEGSKVANHDGSSVYTNLDSIIREQGVIDTFDTSSNHEDEDGDVIDEDRFQDLTQKLVHKLLGEGNNSTSNIQKDSIAKLVYSRRDLNVYERSPSRRKDTSFKYAGKEQSRLMETSLSNITPGYLNMHQLANLASTNSGSPINIENQNQLQMLFKHYAQRHPGHSHHNHNHHHHNQHHPNHPHNHHQNHHQSSSNNIAYNGHQQQQQQQHQHSKQGSQHLLQENVDQRQLALRRICLQDANGTDNLNSHTLLDNQKLVFTYNSPSGSAHANNVNRIKSGVLIQGDPVSQEQPNSANLEDIGTGNTDTKNQPKESLPQDLTTKNTQVLRVQDMSSKIILPNKSRIPATPLTNNTPDGGTHLGVVSDNQRLAPSPRNIINNTNNDTPDSLNKVGNTDNKTPSNDNNNSSSNISSVLMKYYHKNNPNNIPDHHKSEENSLSFRSQGGSSSTGHSPSAPFFPVADLLPAVESNLRRRKKKGLVKHSQMMYRSHTMLDSNLWKKEGINTTAETLQFTGSYQDLSNASPMASTPFDELARLGFKGDRQQLMASQKAFGPPKFRPHHALSPLQRAKEIANRRIHGYLSKYPDGSEAVRVSSPQFLPSKYERINSASKAQTRDSSRISCDVKALIKSCPVNSRRRSSTFVCSED